MTNGDLACRIGRWLWARARLRRRRRKLERWAERWLARHAPVAVPLEGARIVLDGAGMVSRSVFLCGGRELADEAVFRALLRPGMVVFDVGANLGIYTLLAAMRVGPEGAVHAFEPAPGLHALLAESVRRSRLHNVRLNQAAVSDTAGELPLYLGEGSYTDIHSLAPSEQRTGEIRVPVMTLAEYAAAHAPRVDLLKIDVEGAELPAFRGAGALLRGSGAPLLQVELCEENAAGFGYTSPVLKRHLAECGYTAYRAPREGVLPPVDPDEPHPKWENVFFIKPEHRVLLPAGWRLGES